jgi:hypothetical protein
MAVWHSALKKPPAWLMYHSITWMHYHNWTQVTAEHAQAAYDESFDSVHMFMLLNAPPLAKVLLAAILQERRATGAPLQGGPSCRLAAVSGLVPTISVVHVGASRLSSSGRCHCLESECATLCLSWSNVMCG